MTPSHFRLPLARMYGPQRAARVEPHLRALLERWRGRIPAPAGASLSERDAMLITYGDQLRQPVDWRDLRQPVDWRDLRQPGQPPLQTLADFCETHLPGLVSAVHILPFFPWSSDDGFSVMDYRAVDPALGSWDDVQRLGRSFRLMFDGVINHASAQGAWFQAFLRDEAPYRDYFLTVAGSPDLSQVVRPRALPLLTEFQTRRGPRRVWTTFSADQVDLDFHNPDVLLEIIDILLFYAGQGAQFLRLDAIAYLWKEIGTPCLHLPQTHAFIQLLRAVLDDVAPHVSLITETNVPHQENLSYFGDGIHEAQLVYNFALPPLVLHTFHNGDAGLLSQWASGLALPSSRTTFFNFLASHDGIGLNPARGILSPAEIDGLVERTQANGGRISFKQNVDGTRSPYELNINYFDALSDPAGGEPLEIQVSRFMAAQAILLALQGVPGIYFHSLFGSRSWAEGVTLTGQNRTINRQKLERAGLEAELADPSSLRAQVFGRYRSLLLQRAASPAFHPQGGQAILDLGPAIFAVLRTSPAGDRRVLCLQNVTPRLQSAAGHTLGPFETLWVDNPSIR